MNWFRPNLDRKGRLLRGGLGLALLTGGAWLLWDAQPWSGGALMAGSIVVLFEAVRGWCIVRACGIKTKY